MQLFVIDFHITTLENESNQSCSNKFEIIQNFENNIYYETNVKLILK